LWDEDKAADPSGKGLLNSAAKRSEAVAAIGVGPHGLAGVGPASHQDMPIERSNYPSAQVGEPEPANASLPPEGGSDKSGFEAPRTNRINT
jgi:hypothetical protein